MCISVCVHKSCSELLRWQANIILIGFSYKCTVQKCSMQYRPAGDHQDWWLCNTPPPHPPTPIPFPHLCKTLTSLKGPGEQTNK